MGAAQLVWGDHVDKPIERILVVDDEESNRSLLSLVLQGVGYEVVQAEDGRSALLYAQENLSCAFVDMHLPDMQGTAVVQALRHANPDLFIITATMDDDPQTIHDAYDAGCDMFLVKPFDIAKLPQLVKQSQRGQHWIVDRLGMRVFRKS